MVIVGCLIYAIGYYHRNTTSVLLSSMAKSLNVSISELGVLSSTYFWSYAVIQPFVGSLSDLFDTSYIVSTSLFITFIGSLGCAFSRNFYLTCFLRFLVGFGCGCLYVPICRTYAQCFSPCAFPYVQSVVVAFGGLGGLLAQGPLGKANTEKSWPIAFYIGSSISFVLIFFAFFFLKASPDAKSDTSEPNDKKKTFKESMVTLLFNIKKCILFRDFWFLALWKFLTPSTYNNVSSTWGHAYLTKGLNFSKNKAANYISMTSFAWTVGAPFLSLVSNWTHTRKWCLFVCTLIATGSTLVFAFVIGVVDTSNINFNALILAMLFIFALNSGASLTIAAITFKEMLAKELVGTLMGCGNFFLMIGTSIETDITAALVDKYEDKDENVPLIAFRYGLWLLSAASCGISLIFILLLKDTYHKAIKETDGDSKKKIENPDSIEVPMIEDHKSSIDDGL